MNTLANPRRVDHHKLWPASNWEVRRWTREDWMGFAYSIPAMAGIMLLFWLFTRLGR